MTLSEYFQQLPHGAKQQLAKQVGISKPWMSRLIRDHGHASAELAKRIEQATSGQVTRADLRPDLFV